MTESVTRYARTEDGVRIAFEFVEGHDPVLFLSPMLGSQPTFIEWAPPWRAYRDVLRRGNAMTNLAHRGIGISGPAPGPVSLPDLVRDLEAVANALPGRDLFVFASGGGCVPALEFIAAHQERVTGLFLDGPTRSGLPPAFRAAMQADMEGALFMTGRALFSWAEDDALTPKAREWARGLPEDVFWQTVAACEDYDFVSGVQRLTVPVILRGYDYGREEAAEIAAECPDVRLDLQTDQILGPAQAERQRELMAPHLDAPPTTNAGAVPTSEARETTPRLTPKQLEVLRLAARGLRDKQIAEELSISAGTARRHMSDILNRTGQPNRTAAVTYARDHGLLD